ncbi:hypothetical protein Tco_0495864 [Tanacetum coccineum]
MHASPENAPTSDYEEEREGSKMDIEEEDPEEDLGMDIDEDDPEEDQEMGFKDEEEYAGMPRSLSSTLQTTLARERVVPPCKRFCFLYAPLASVSESDTPSKDIT